MFLGRGQHSQGVKLQEISNTSSASPHPSLTLVLTPLTHLWLPGPRNQSNTPLPGAEQRGNQFLWDWPETSSEERERGVRDTAPLLWWPAPAAASLDFTRIVWSEPSEITGCSDAPASDTDWESEVSSVITSELPVSQVLLAESGPSSEDCWH